jgi:hypothetical protein
MDDGTKAAMHQIEAFLVSAKDVEAVEFLRFKDDPTLVENQAEIESAKASLTQTRKESASGEQRNAESSDRAAGHESAGESPATAS